jgi:hypothetical protein
MLRLPGIKGLRSLLKMEGSLRRAMQLAVPPKEDEGGRSRRALVRQVPSAWGLIAAAQGPISWVTRGDGGELT